MEIDDQPTCMSCGNGFHHRYFQGHSYDLNGGRNYHTSVEKNAYFKKDENAIHLLALYSEKGLFSLLPLEIILKIESYLNNYFCTNGSLPVNMALPY